MLKIKNIAIIFMAMLLSMMMVIPGFATEADTVSNWIADNVTISGNTLICKDSNMKKLITTEQDDAAVDESGSVIVAGTVGDTNIYVAKGKELGDLNKRITQIKNNKATSETVSDITTGSGVGADVDGAMVFMEGFVPTVNIIIGFLTVIVMLGMGILTAVDIAYIAFPIVRIEASGSNGKKGFVASLVSQDAQTAVKNGTVENGKSPWGIYFKSRIITYILLAIIIYILLTGNLSLIVNLALNMVSGIMNVLQGLAV